VSEQGTGVLLGEKDENREVFGDHGSEAALVEDWGAPVLLLRVGFEVQYPVERRQRTDSVKVTKQGYEDKLQSRIYNRHPQLIIPLHSSRNRRQTYITQEVHNTNHLKALQNHHFMLRIPQHRE
jgi:hypothetical protein